MKKYLIFLLLIVEIIPLSIGSGEPPVISATWNVPSYLVCGEPAGVSVAVCNNGGDAILESTGFFDGIHFEKSTYPIASGQCITMGWGPGTGPTITGDMAVNGYVEYGVVIVMNNDHGTDSWAETIDIPVRGCEPVDPCSGVDCPSECYGCDLWAMKCENRNGEPVCVKDYIIERDSPYCCEIPEGDPPEIEVGWYVPNVFEYGKPNPLYFEITNKGGSANGENELWISGYSTGLSTWSLGEGDDFLTGWKDDFYLEDKHIKDGYVTLRFYVRMWNDYGSDTYDETRKVRVSGHEEEEEEGGIVTFTYGHYFVICPSEYKQKAQGWVRDANDGAYAVMGDVLGYYPEVDSYIVEFKDSPYAGYYDGVKTIRGVTGGYIILDLGLLDTLEQYPDNLFGGLVYETIHGFLDPHKRHYVLKRSEDFDIIFEVELLDRLGLQWAVTQLYDTWYPGDRDFSICWDIREQYGWRYFQHFFRALEDRGHPSVDDDDDWCYYMSLFVGEDLTDIFENHDRSISTRTQERINQELGTSSSEGNKDPCEGKECPPQCYGCDYWARKCVDGKCVKDYIIEEESRRCGCGSGEEGQEDSSQENNECLGTMLIFVAVIIGILVSFYKGN
jgi:hypothetical protein